MEEVCCPDDVRLQEGASTSGHAGNVPEPSFQELLQKLAVAHEREVSAARCHQSEAATPGDAPLQAVAAFPPLPERKFLPTTATPGSESLQAVAAFPNPPERKRVSRGGTLFSRAPPQATAFFKQLWSAEERMPDVCDDEVSHPLKSVTTTEMPKTTQLYLCSLALIILNAAFVGWQVQLRGAWVTARRPGGSFFCTCFVAELAVTWKLEGRSFFHVKKLAWHLFDSAVILLLFLGVLLDLPWLQYLSIWRILHVVRLGRLLPTLRVASHFRNLRLLCSSLQRVSRMLVWMVVALTLLFYTFGVSISSAVLDQCDGDSSRSKTIVCSHFGTIDRSMFSLYKVMYGGMLWGDLVDALVDLDIAYAVLFVIFVFVALIVAANTATGLFVQMVLDAEKHQSQNTVYERMVSKRRCIQAMRDVFHLVDINSSQTVTLDELNHALHDERMCAFLLSFDLDIHDITNLFGLLDRDGNGFVDISEFVFGCLRLKGEASTLDMLTLQVHTERCMHKVEQLKASTDMIVAALAPQSFDAIGGQKGIIVADATDSSAGMYSNIQDFDYIPYRRDTSRPRIRIDKAEERAMLVSELQRVASVIRSRCVREQWKDMRTGTLLSPSDVNLYHFNYYIVCPATAPVDGVGLSGAAPGSWAEGQHVEQADPGGKGLVRVVPAQGDVDVIVTVTRGRFVLGNSLIVAGAEHCGPREVSSSGAISYKEAVSSRPTTPRWFCSHWWGGSVLDFIACCEDHSARRHRHEDIGYWVCSYANCQHDPGSDIGEDPDTSSFRLAMQKAEGTLLILDPQATPFQRIWCCYELFMTLFDGKPLDIITMHTGMPMLLSDERMPLPLESTEMKSLREQSFPIAILLECFKRKLEDGDATIKEDKDTILLSIANSAREIPDHDSRLQLALRRANSTLHGRFALAAWPQAVKRGIVSDFGEEALPQILTRDEERRRLQLSLAHCEIMDADLLSLAEGFPPRLEELELSFANCHHLTDSGIECFSHRLPSSLRALALDFQSCKHVSNYGVKAVAEQLPNKLERLRLSYAFCEQIDCESIDALLQHLPPTLSTCFASFRGTHIDRDFKSIQDLRKHSGKTVSGVKRSMPRSMKRRAID